MNQADANKQIEQMIAFIMQEAKEKAEEIRVKTEKEFMADKLSIETQQNVVIRQEHEKMKKQALIQKKIEKSKKSAESRFAVMRARNDRMVELKDAVIKRLASIGKQGKQYSQLIRYLIAQGLLTIMENNVRLRVRKEDIDIVKTELPAALDMYKKAMVESSGVTPNCTVDIDTEFLPPAPVEGKVGNFSCGGVELWARGGQIICRNTIDHRLDLAFEALKPAIRGALFGYRAQAESKPAEKKGHH